MREDKNEHAGKVLAKKLVWVQDALTRAKESNSIEYEFIKDEFKELQNEILASGYDINSIINWGEQYKTLTITEHREWIKA